MSQKIAGSFDLSYGIQDILPFEHASLPGKPSVAPTDIPEGGLLRGIYAPRNRAAALDAFLRPEVKNLESLRPDTHAAALRDCLALAQGQSSPAAVSLAALLEENSRDAALLAAFQGLLVAG
jgi:hypothetical protein